MNAPEAVPHSTSSGASAEIVPVKLAHYVIRAKKFQEMLAWYRKVFHLKTSFEAPVIAFLTYDEEHHRIAFLNTEHLPSPDTMRTGIDHVAFTYANIRDLLGNYERLRGEGIGPFWCINHGMSTSMYYRDPDGNEIELQVDNFPSMDECKAWFASQAFAANPIGVQFDPEVLLAKMHAGAPDSELLRQGAAPLPPEREYVFDKLPPPPG